MDFDFTKDQRLLQKSVRELFSKECPTDRIRDLKLDKSGFDKKLWKKMVKLGYTGLVLPEIYGGMDGTFFDLMIVMEEIGRNIVPIPYFTTVVQCALPILKFASSEQKEALLPLIAEKGEIWAYAMSEEMTDYDLANINLKAEKTGTDFVLNGTKLFIPHANVANKLLVVARTLNDQTKEGISLFYLDTSTAGVKMEVIPTAAKDNRCEISFDQVRIPDKNLIGKFNFGWEVVDYILQCSSVLKAAEMSAGAQAALNMTVKYCKERKQFDKPIASFQAIQHKLVELLTEVDGLKHLVHRAVFDIQSGNPSRKLNAMAKIKANTVYHQVCHNGIYLHGAIGWTEEMDIGLYHIRTQALNSDGGGTHLHLRNLASEQKKYQPDFMEIYS